MRQLICALLVVLALTGCDKHERKPLTSPSERSEQGLEERAARRRMKLFERYDTYLRKRIAEQPGLGLSAGEPGEGRDKARKPVLKALGISATTPAASVEKIRNQRFKHARIEVWRVSGAGIPDVPALLWLPADSRPRAAIVLANGTGQNKHDFISQLSCSAYVAAGAACVSWDPLGEGERSADPMTRGRELLNDDLLAISADIGRPYLGEQVQEIRRLISALKADERTGDLPLAVAGYSLGGWTGLLTGLVDDRIDALVAASTLVIPEQIPGLAAGGWRIPRLHEVFTLDELLAMNAWHHPMLWINGGKDASFIPDERRRVQVMEETAQSAEALLGDREGRLSYVLVPDGPHLPYYIVPPALSFLGVQQVLPRLEKSGLATRPLQPMTERLPAVGATTELKWWPRELIETPFAPKDLPLVPAKKLLAGDGPYPQMPDWVAPQIAGARAASQLPRTRAELGAALRPMLAPRLDSLTTPNRWKRPAKNQWEDSLVGLQARVESGSGGGLMVYFPRARTLLDTRIPDSLSERAGRILLFEPLSYSDNEVVAGTTATGQTLAALLALLKTPDFQSIESYEIVDGTGTLGAPLALIDARVSALDLPTRPLTTIAPTRFHFEGHVPGFTSVLQPADVLAALAPLPLRIREGVLLDEEKERLGEAYREAPEKLTFYR